MPQESDATQYRRIFVDLMREIFKLRADHEALMQVLIEEIDPLRAVQVVGKYDARRKDLWEHSVSQLEDSLPKLAADLDEHRPLIEPDDGDEKS